MSGYIERTQISQVGRPVAAPLKTLPDGSLLGAILLGGSDKITSLDASWFRDLANAAYASANALEAEQPVDTGLPEGREPQTDGTQMFAVVDQMPECEAEPAEAAS